MACSRPQFVLARIAESKLDDMNPNVQSGIMETTAMVVKFRFGQGAMLARRKGRNSRVARLVASILTLGAVSSGILGFWRLGQDLGFLGDFAFTAGLVSHWQFWLAVTIAMQYTAWRLTRYARRARLVRASAPKDESQEPSRTRTVAS